MNIGQLEYIVHTIERIDFYCHAFSRCLSRQSILALHVYAVVYDIYA